MKVEVGSFTPASSSVTVILDDDTLVIKGLEFKISKTGSNVNFSSGFTDGTTNKAEFTLYDTVKASGRTSSYCIYHKADVSGTATVKLAAIPTSLDTGEFTLNFANYDNSYTVDFMAFGE